MDNKIVIDNIKDITHVEDLTRIGVLNGYTVLVEPKMELYWKQKIDHYTVTYITKEEEVK